MSALAAFNTHKDAIACLATDIHNTADASFWTDPDYVNWGHVGVLAEAHVKLRQAVDVLKGLSRIEVRPDSL